MSRTLFVVSSWSKPRAAYQPARSLYRKVFRIQRSPRFLSGLLVGSAVGYRDRPEYMPDWVGFHRPIHQEPWDAPLHDRAPANRPIPDSCVGSDRPIPKYQPIHHSRFGGFLSTARYIRHLWRCPTESHKPFRRLYTHVRLDRYTNKIGFFDTWVGNLQRSFKQRIVNRYCSSHLLPPLILHQYMHHITSELCLRLRFLVVICKPNDNRRQHDDR